MKHDCHEIISPIEIGSEGHTLGNHMQNVHCRSRLMVKIYFPSFIRGSLDLLKCACSAGTI